MKRNQARMIIGTAISAATIAVAVDHTRQRLPEPEEHLASQEAVIIIDEGEQMPDENNMDCGKSVARARQGSPCSL
jgi:hypothetical protein